MAGLRRWTGTPLKAEAFAAPPFRRRSVDLMTTCRRSAMPSPLSLATRRTVYSRTGSISFLIGALLSGLSLRAQTATPNPTVVPSNSEGPAPQNLRPPAVHPSGAFKFAPPDRWRQLTIPEARLLGRTRATEFPVDLVDWRNLTPDYMPYGDVASWIEREFDGVCLVTYMLEGEVSLEDEDESRRQIQSGAESASSQAGVVHEILGLDSVQLASAQKGYLARSRLRFGENLPVYRALEYYLPTAGSTLLLVFRAPEATFAQFEPEFRAVADSVILARAPRGRSGLGGRLLEALLLGSLVGAVLVFIYQRKNSKRTEPPEPTELTELTEPPDPPQGTIA